MRHITLRRTKKNEEEVKYKNAIESIDLSGISDTLTKTAFDKILVAIKSFKETTKNG